MFFFATRSHKSMTCTHCPSDLASNIAPTNTTPKLAVRFHLPMMRTTLDLSSSKDCCTCLAWSTLLA